MSEKDRQNYQIKWKFDDEQLHEIDALTLNKSEGAFIDYLCGLAKAANIKIEIKNIARKQGSFLSDIAVFIGHNKEMIQPAVLLLIGAATGKFFSPNPKPKPSDLEVIHELIDIQEKVNNCSLTFEQAEVYVESSKVFKKQKNIFFKTNKANKVIKEIIVSEIQDSKKEIATILSKNFDNYISSNENGDNEIQNAKIYIISPVIVAGSNEMWSGEYLNERIRFYVKDKEFLEKAQSNQIRFNTGFYIDCTLRKKIRLVEGEEKPFFDVMTINKYASDEKHEFTFTHKLKRRNTSKVNPNQFSLFNENDLENEMNND